MISNLDSFYHVTIIKGDKIQKWKKNQTNILIFNFYFKMLKEWGEYDLTSNGNFM